MDVIPRIVEEGMAFAHPFNMSCVGAREGQKPYWRDVGTL
ncbi:MAG: glucose-phosphate adenylyltransferase, partial [Pseudomonadota bacterium]